MWRVGHGLYLSGSIYGSVPTSCERGNEFSVSIKAGEFLNHLSNYQLFRGRGSSLCLIKDHTMNMYKKMEVYLLALLNLPAHGQFDAPVRVRGPGAYCIEEWVAAWPVLTLWRRKNLFPCRESNSDSSFDRQYGDRATLQPYWGRNVCSTSIKREGKRTGAETTEVADPWFASRQFMRILLQTPLARSSRLLSNRFQQVPHALLKTFRRGRSYRPYVRSRHQSMR
jgi:hypothetical protein